ncbi:polysaccharide lyase family 7 protein [Nonlabens sp. Asnod2-A12]|uniref:polysaccharide lyase family 7 protein n=1 Tax=Nonlabens sp. Asnod2-A12 TaxID=3160578 RepID=UPI00386871EF
MKLKRNLIYTVLLLNSLILINCKSEEKDQNNSEYSTYKSPSEVLSIIEESTITLGNGDYIKDIKDFTHEDYFYTVNDGEDWIVYKTPNSGGTTKNSSNTRSELRLKDEWIPENGGQLSGTLKVTHVSTNGDARVAAAYSVVVGQIHSKEGNENEPIKIFYKKFPGHTKGSVFWNYEINTKDDNSKRWDYSTAVWGYDMSVVGPESNTAPEEPADGIELGEEFSYVINVSDGIMELTFTSPGHETVNFSKDLLHTEFAAKEDLPKQITTLYASIGRDGTEMAHSYAGEIQYFKQGAYNQANGKDPEKNIVWNTGSDIYNGDLKKQYENGSYAEVWFKKASHKVNKASK